MHVKKLTTEILNRKSEQHGPDDMALSLSNIPRPPHSSRDLFKNTHGGGHSQWYRTPRRKQPTTLEMPPLT